MPGALRISDWFCFNVNTWELIPKSYSFAKKKYHLNTNLIKISPKASL